MTRLVRLTGGPVASLAIGRVASAPDARSPAPPAMPAHSPCSASPETAEVERDSDDAGSPRG
jgi:hypothetical protein